MKHPESSVVDVLRVLADTRRKVACLQKLLQGDKILELEDWYYCTCSLGRVDELLDAIRRRYDQDKKE